MFSRIRGVQRRTSGSASGYAGEKVGRRRDWRTLVAGIVIATMTASGAVLTAAPAMADKPVSTPSDSAGKESAAPVEEEAAAEAPAEAPVAAPEEEPAAPEDPATPAEGEEAASEESADVEPTVEEQSALPGDDAAAGGEASKTADTAPTSEVSLMLVPPGDDVVKKARICHATAAYNNPYVVNNPAADGDVSGHADHTGPVFFPEIDETWGDIIPPFYYEGPEGVEFYEGLNWNAEGQAIYENDCNLPDAPPEPEAPIMEVDATDCLIYLGPSLTVWLYDLQGDVDYRVTVENADGVVDVWDVEGTEGDTSFTWYPIPGGDYTVTFEQAVMGEWEVVATDEFSVTDCPVLGVTAEATACSNGDDGTAVVNLTGLIPDEEYGWTLTGPDGTVAEGTLSELESEALAVDFGELPPGDYMFDVWWPSAEEPVVSAEAAFTVAACPPVPTTPTTPVKPAALAATGSEGTGGLLAAALIMMALGGGALALRGRRPLGEKVND